MIVDTSALVAILKHEPEEAAFSMALEAAASVTISAATYLEASIVVDSMRDPFLSLQLDEILLRSHATIEPVTAEQARIARQAYRDFGRGSGHAANLNFGDCFAYALARTNREPLLYKGDGFIRTGVPAAA